MSYEKITTTNKKLDGSTGISEATIDDSEMSFEESSTPTEPITTSSVQIVDTAIALTDEGLTLADGSTISNVGGGLEVDDGALGVKLAQGGGLSFDEDGAIQFSGGSSSAIAYDGVSLLPSTIEFDSWNLHRGILLNGVLWVVITGLTVSASGLASISDIVEITLPSEIASKLYRIDGTTCNNAPSTNNYICFGIAKNQGTDINLYSSEANKIKVKFDSPIIVSVGNRAIFNVRFPLFLDIGSVE